MNNTSSLVFSIGMLIFDSMISVTLSLAIPDGPIGMYARNMKDIYLRSPEIPDDSWPPVPKTHFINLALLKSSAINFESSDLRFTIHGSVDDIFSDKDEIKYLEVFEGVSSGSRILFEGRPGSGKTTLLNKTSQDWANGTILPDIVLLVLVQLRVFIGKHDVTLADLLTLYCPPTMSVEDLCMGIYSNGGEGVCLVIDGLDEYKPASNRENFIYKLIKGTILPNAVVIVASRPAASQQFRRTVTRSVEVLGFRKEQICEYITDYYAEDNQKACQLIAYLDQHTNIKHACYIPLHIAMVTFLFDCDGLLPETETEIYEHFTLHTLIRAIKRTKESNPEECISLTTTSELPPQKLNVFNQVCRLAFEATVHSKQVFSQNEVRTIFTALSKSKEEESLGLITVDRRYARHGLEEIYSFCI